MRQEPTHHAAQLSIVVGNRPGLKKGRRTPKAPEAEAPDSYDAIAERVYGLACQRAAEAGMSLCEYAVKVLYPSLAHAPEAVALSMDAIRERIGGGK